jgi:phosphatidate cytidylyltransferase
VGVCIPEGIHSINMLKKRVAVVIILLPIGLAGILLGGWAYNLGIAAILALAAWEYVQLMNAGGFRPALVLTAGGAALLALGRGWNGFTSAAGLLSLLVLLSMVYHLVAYERGRDQSGSDFGITLGGIAYLGWIGAYFISLRALPDGKWWALFVLPVIWVADSGAYFIGVRFGRHRLSPRLSPKKSWEGYIAGVVTGTLAGALLAWAWTVVPSAWGPPVSAAWPPVWKGALFGFILAALTTLGDLGESMIKRQMGVKDSGRLLPGHGGVFDRIDSWLWGAVIGYYLAVLL